MKKLILILVLITSITVAFFASLLFVGQDKIESIPIVGSLAQKLKKSTVNMLATEEDVVVHLANGGSISARLVLESEDHVVLDWNGSQVTFTHDEIISIERGKIDVGGDGIYVKEAKIQEKKWDYQNNPVIELNTGVVLDAKIADVSDEKVILREEFEEGGYVEREVDRKDIFAVHFKFVKTKESEEIKKELESKFPKKDFIDVGFVTLVTDSTGSSLNNFKRTVREQTRDFYLEFFHLINYKEPRFQNHVVIFDQYLDYIRFGLDNLIPAWLMLGWFNPAEEVLYTYNSLGEVASQMIYSAISRMKDSVIGSVGHLGREHQRRHVESEVGRRYHEYHEYIRSVMSSQTLATVRHEMTHQLFSNWNLQDVVISEMTGARVNKNVKEEREKFFSKEFGHQDKKNSILSMLGVSGEESTTVVTAANSWYVEGLAAYTQTVPLGSPTNDMFLFFVKDARKNDALLPIEQLTVYEFGSFRGVDQKEKISAYSQSWSLVHYLMKKHKKAFFKYLKRLSIELGEDGDDIIWLLEALDISLRELEEGWHQHIDTLPDSDDPELASLSRVLEIFS